MDGEYIINISPVFKKIGTNSITGIVDSYFNAEVYVGNYSSIASTLYVHGATEHPCVFNKRFVSTYPFGDKWNVDYPKASSKGKIEIGSDVWVGEGVTLLSGVKIGNGAIVGAKSVVAKAVPPFAIVAGNPVQLIRYRFTTDVIMKLQKIQWWNWSEQKISENIELMKDVDKFIKIYDK